MSSSDNHALERQGTIDQTIEESEGILESMGGRPDPDMKTRSQQHGLEKWEKYEENLAKEEEGIEYLKDTHADALLTAQELVPPSENDSKATGAMTTTVEESEGILESMGGRPDPDMKTRSQQHGLEKWEKYEENLAKAEEAYDEKAAKKRAYEDDDTPPEEAEDVDGKEESHKRPRLGRESTIQQTLKDAEAFLGQDQPEDESTPAVRRTATMAETIKEGKEFVNRGEDQPSPTKTYSMEQTIKEGHEFVDGNK